VIGDALSVAYGAIATWRRRWYAAPGRARRLARPVISIGNLRVGGSGKTPVVAAIARMLIAQGERPVVLSRGYARRKVTPGVTVVSDRERVLVDVEHAGEAGDEILQLLVAPDAQGRAEGWLYEDAGDGFGFERGEYRRTRFTAELRGGELRVAIASSEGAWQPPGPRTWRVTPVGASPKRIVGP